MNKLFLKFVKVCPKSGRVRKIIFPKGYYRLLFPLIGLAALIWILIRVLPKPSRADYPCIKAATPLASGFIIYFASLIVSAIAFARTKKRVFLSPYFLIAGLAIFGFSDSSDLSLNAGDIDHPLPSSVHLATSPMGVAKGIFPGRVVWVYNPNAVNQNCDPSLLNHAWWAAENNDQNVINAMVSKVIQNLTGKTTDKDSWEAIFKYHNNTRGKGAVNYVAGEKVFIKINECSAWSGNINTKDLSRVNGSWYGMSETSPAFILSVLHQLVDIVHVAQTDIYVGDPIRNLYKEWYEQLHSKYPDVHYLGHDNYTSLGREQAIASNTALIHYSDRGTVLHPNISYSLTNISQTKIWNDKLYTIFEDAEYMINIPQLKGHMRAGITMFAKNHFGSQTRGDAMHLHLGLPCPIEMSRDTSRVGYGLYRVQVDLMTQSILRKKNLLFLMDGLWGTDYEQDKPLKFQMAPFNNTYSSSVFASLDNVAIESVGYDFLRSEFTAARGAGTFVQMRGADDYLHQAADSTNWAAGIKYDPDSTGVHIFSLGVHEHWNNANDKQYSRNLGTGTGIELLQIRDLTPVENVNTLPAAFQLSQNYPNPFNPSTIIEYSIPKSQKVKIYVYDIAGREVAMLENAERTAGTYRIQFDAKLLASGVYYYRMTAGDYSETKKLIVLK
jgi:hypothetical protein